MNLTTAQQCAYPSCDQPVAPPTSDRGAKPKYCDDASHNPLTAHRDRRKREADGTGQRAEETGGQPVTFGLTRAAELILKLENLTAQHADALTRAIAELRSAGDVESAEAEVYAARTFADQRIAAAAAQAITRMDDLQHELTALHQDTSAQLSQLRVETAAQLEQARATAEHDIGQAREQMVMTACQCRR